METDIFTNQLSLGIEHAIRAHQSFPRSPEKAVRFWDHKTPYVVHPILASALLLAEITLPDSIREPGFLALLWHDTLEDTTLPLPAQTSAQVKALVVEMTFDSFDEECEKLWNRGNTTKLLKLYDKVSNLLDNAWRTPERWNKQVRHAERLTDWVEENFGPLNIVKIARAVIHYR